MRLTVFLINISFEKFQSYHGQDLYEKHYRNFSVTDLVLLRAGSLPNTITVYFSAVFIFIAALFYYFNHPKADSSGVYFKGKGVLDY